MKKNTIITKFLFAGIAIVLSSFCVTAVFAQWAPPTADPTGDNPTLRFGAFEESSSVIQQAGSPGYTEDFVVGSPTLDDNGTQHIRMFFDASKGAFRAGETDGGNWDEALVGLNSVAFGYDTSAPGSYSSAFGWNSFANGMGSTAFGRQGKAYGDYSFVAGGNTRANADYTTTIGRYVYNDIAESFMVGFKSSLPSSHTGDPGFFVNKDNNVGMGTTTIDTGLRLDIAGRVGASEYCDENGNNCTPAASLSGGGMTGSMVGANYFGDGSDGDVVVSSDTTLTRDMYYNNLTVPNGITLNSGGYRIFVKDTLTISGSGRISRDGNDGSDGGDAMGWVGGAGGSGGAALPEYYLTGGAPGADGVAGPNGQGLSGGAGYVGNTGNNGVDVADGLGDDGVDGVSGGTSGTNGFTGTGKPGGVGGSGGVVTLTPMPKNLSEILLFRDFVPAIPIKYNASAGAASGGSGASGRSSANARGGGGGGSAGSGASGGIIMVFAKNLNIDGTISADGGDGGIGGDGGDADNWLGVGSGGAGGGGGAGGSGGTGGIVIVGYSNKTGSGSITANGGQGGAGGERGHAVNKGANFQDGGVGQDGLNGNQGTAIEIVI